MGEVLRMWDSFLGDLANPLPLLQYTCVAMVILIREALLAGDFTDCMRMLQHYPPIPVDHLLESAARLRAADLVPSGFSNEQVEVLGTLGQHRSRTDDGDG